MTAKEALELKQARERTLVDIEGRLPEGRRNGELTSLVNIAKHAHKALIKYDRMSESPEVAETLASTFVAVVNQIDVLTAAKPD